MAQVGWGFGRHRVLMLASAVSFNALSTSGRSSSAKSLRREPCRRFRRALSRGVHRTGHGGCAGVGRLAPVASPASPFPLSVAIPVTWGSLRIAGRFEPASSVHFGTAQRFALSVPSTPVWRPPILHELSRKPRRDAIHRGTDVAARGIAWGGS